MGCDIHVYLERKFSDGPWEIEPKHKIKLDDNGEIDDIDSISTFSARNYTFFGEVAGVRSFSKPKIPPRGLPQDASKEIQKLYTKNLYWHTCTWLSPEEMQEAMSLFEKKYSLDSYNRVDRINWLWEGDSARCWENRNDIGRHIDNSALLYIEKEIINNNLDNVLLGADRQLQFRFIIWFDS